MKVTIYIDTYPGMDAKYIFPTPVPSQKLPGNTRYRIDFELPDPSKPDVRIDDVTVTETEPVDD